MVFSSRINGAFVLVLGILSGQFSGTASVLGQTSGQDYTTNRIQGASATKSVALATRRRFLEMFARAYVPGRTGHLLIVPREGDFFTRADPNISFMHGSPWPYDVSIPLLFVGPSVKSGIYSIPAVQQDVAPTLASALGVKMPPTTTGHKLPILLSGTPAPKVVFLLVLDGMRRDYFDRYSQLMPTLTSLRRQGAWFGRAQVNVLPTNTAVGHSTISTGTDPRIHGISGVSTYDQKRRRRREIFAAAAPEDLLTPTLADVWQLATSGQAIILSQGSIDRAATPLAGHGACQLKGTAVILVSYAQETGSWTTNANCFRLPTYLKNQNARDLWPADGEWMHHRIDSTSNVRYSGLFPVFEAKAMIEMIQREALGEDAVPDLILMNYKGADFVGHKHGPDSNELRVTLSEMDRYLAEIIQVLQKKVGNNYLLAVTADHGMPSEPASPERRHLAPAIVDLLHNRFDPKEKLLITSFEPENAQIFVDEDRLTFLGLTLHQLAQYLESQPFVFAVFTNEEVRRAGLR